MTTTNSGNGDERLVWPSGGGTVLLEPGEDAGGTAAFLAYGAGAEVRVRGWWVIGDPEAHNRVGTIVPSC